MIALFTKYDQFRLDVKMNLEDEPGHPEVHIDAEVKRVFEQHYLAGLSGPPPFICLQSESFFVNEPTFYFCAAGMHENGQRCTDLIKLTANSLSGGVVALMLVAVQKDNLELSINHAIEW